MRPTEAGKISDQRMGPDKQLQIVDPRAELRQQIGPGGYAGDVAADNHPPEKPAQEQETKSDVAREYDGQGKIFQKPFGFFPIELQRVALTIKQRLVNDERRRQRDGRRFGAEAEREGSESGRMPRACPLATAPEALEKAVEGEEIKKSRENGAARRDIIHRLRIDRVYGEKRGGKKRRASGGCALAAEHREHDQVDKIGAADVQQEIRDAKRRRIKPGASVVEGIG